MYPPNPQTEQKVNLVCDVVDRILLHMEDNNISYKTLSAMMHYKLSARQLRSRLKPCFAINCLTLGDLSDILFALKLKVELKIS